MNESNNEELLYEIIEFDENQLLSEEFKFYDFLFKVLEKIHQAEEDIENNKGIDAKESLKRMKEKYDL